MADDFINYYAILGLTRNADEAAIRKAYRKAALKHHPDKNPDDPDGAAARFDAAKKARDVLNDPAARAKLDKSLSAKEARELRFKELDEEKQAQKQSLERREREAAAARQTARTSDWAAADIARLRASGLAFAEEAARSLAEHEEAAAARNARRAEAERVDAAAKATAAARSAELDVELMVKVKWGRRRDKEAGEGGLSPAGVKAAFEAVGASVAEVIPREGRKVFVRLRRAADVAAVVDRPPKGLTVQAVAKQPAVAGSKRKAGALGGGSTAAEGGAGAGAGGGVGGAYGTPVFGRKRARVREGGGTPGQQDSVEESDVFQMLAAASAKKKAARRARLRPTAVPA